MFDKLYGEYKFRDCFINDDDKEEEKKKHPNTF